MPFVVLGLLLIGGGALHVGTQSGPPWVSLAEMAIPGIAGFSLLYASYRVSKSQMPVQNTLRILNITLGLVSIALLITGYNLALRASVGDPITDPVYNLLVALAAGAAIGAPLGFYYVDLQETHSELETQYEQTLTLNKRLSVAQRVLRHNLRNELTVLVGIADTFTNEPTPEDVETYAPMLATHTDRLLELTTKAKLLSQVWKPTELERFDIGAVVEDALTAVSTAHSNVDVELSIPGAAPVFAHPMFPRAIDELVENAVEHNDLEELKIAASVRTELGPHNRTRVEIADTGTGIPEIEMAAVKQSTEEPLSHGTGLGLWLVYSLTKQSKGDLSFEENDPSGTVVQIDLLSPATGDSDRQTSPVLDDGPLAY